MGDYIKEYNEDPVLKTMLPATWLSARRRTILVFYNNPTTKVYKNLLLLGIALEIILKLIGI